MNDDEIQHFSHCHLLKPEISSKLFICEGCKERGWGARYTCEKCKYNLHKDCALAPPSKNHPFFERCTFNLCLHGTGDPYCTACEKVVLGYVYYNATKQIYLHPCCAHLPLRLEGEDHDEYQLRERISSKCGRCERKDKGWSYRNKKKDHNFHLSCLNDMAVEKCEKTYLSKIGGKNLSGEISIAPNLQLTRYRGKVSWKEKMRKIGKVVRNLFITTITGDPTGGAILMKSVLS